MFRDARIQPQSQSDSSSGTRCNLLKCSRETSTRLRSVRFMEFLFFHGSWIEELSRWETSRWSNRVRLYFTIFNLFYLVILFNADYVADCWNLCGILSWCMKSGSVLPITSGVMFMISDKILMAYQWLLNFISYQTVLCPELLKTY